MSLYDLYTGRRLPEIFISAAQDDACKRYHYHDNDSDNDRDDPAMRVP